MSTMNKHSMLERAKTRMVVNDPFYGTIALDSPYVVDRSIKWAATDGVSIFYNPEAFEKMTLEEAVGVVRHECDHIARMHSFRMGARDPGRWNTATDAIINDGMDKEGLKLPEGVVRVPGASTKFSEEEYYSLLPETPPKGGGGQGNGKGQNQGQGQQPLPQNGKHDPSQNPLANDVRRPPQGSTEETQNEVKSRVARAKNVAKAMGKMPADMESELEELFNPRVGWKEKLLRWCTEKAEDDVSWARPDRRFVASGLYLPGKHSDDAMGEFINIFDTSGSMSDREIGQGMSESVSAIKDVMPTKYVSVYCDSRVQHVDEFTDPQAAEVAKSFKRHGAGGTDMTKALDYVEKHYPNAAAVVVFTDGETPYGEPRPFPVLWGITHERCLDRPTWGEVVHVEFDDD